MVGRVEGAGAGGYGSKAVFPAGVAGATHLGGQSVSGDINMAQAILTEAIATFFLVFVVFGTAVDPSAPKVGGFAIGLTVTADILAIGSPARGSVKSAALVAAATRRQSVEAQGGFSVGPHTRSRASRGCRSSHH